MNEIHLSLTYYKEFGHKISERYRERKEESHVIHANARDIQLY